MLTKVSGLGGSGGRDGAPDPLLFPSEEAVVGGGGVGGVFAVGGPNAVHRVLLVGGGKAGEDGAARRLLRDWNPLTGGGEVDGGRDGLDLGRGNVTLLEELGVPRPQLVQEVGKGQFLRHREGRANQRGGEPLYSGPLGREKSGEEEGESA